jgi:hypothetical protein
VATEGMFCALIRAVCTDLQGPAENPGLPSCDEGFLRSYTEQLRHCRDFFFFYTDGGHPDHRFGMGLSPNRHPVGATIVLVWYRR